MSPSAVHDFPVEGLPTFSLHSDLQQLLPQRLVERVSFYSVIHDINKEATAMAQNDGVQAREGEAESPLVRSVLGKPVSSSVTADTSVAVIDEESWLLSAIEGPETEDDSRQCPATFLQAMGEKEYENPVSSLSGGSRTQLWKPSRSWWEAKSGKNPWIEPASHNKRWRYLWPLIHYHKFLAKCIKKLKRNGVDVTKSKSSVAVFLREDVCAVSDHLAFVSLFGSDEWMACLQHFHGWTDTSTDGENLLREHVAQLKLRSFQEPGDVDSPLLRSQIDQQFLVAMNTQRAQLKECYPAKSNKDATHRPPPMYPKSGRTSPLVPKQVATSQDKARQRWYPYYPHYDPNQPHVFTGDTSSVHSALSTDSYAHEQVYGTHVNPYYHAGYNTSDVSQGSYDPSQHPYDPVAHAQMMQQWMAAQAAMMYNPYYYPHPTTEPALVEKPSDEKKASEEDYGTPYKEDSSQQQPIQSSPYWAHLDSATLAMGLATPAKASPSTPRRPSNSSKKNGSIPEGRESKESDFVANALPLYLHHNPYSGYGHQYRGDAGSVPPSPATQFMMSPQANFAYKQGYGVSPRKPRQRSASKKQTISTPVKSTRRQRVPTTPPRVSITPPPPVRKLVATPKSPATVETAADSASLTEVAL